jgi:hypothetical protein
VTGMYLPDACDRKRTNVQVKHTVSFKGISSSKADSNNPMHFGSAKRSMHGVYSECIWCATVAISNKPTHFGAAGRGEGGLGSGIGLGASIEAGLVMGVGRRPQR